MIHRKLQNVVYMEKKNVVKKKKKGGGEYLIKKKEKKREQHRILSTSTCVLFRIPTRVACF